MFARTFTLFTAANLVLLNAVTDEAGSTSGTSTPVTEVPKTKRELLIDKANLLAEKHAEVLAAIKQIDDKAAAEAKVGNVKPGDRLDATVGKGDKAVRLVNVEVVGVAEVEGRGKQIKVVTGTGFETQVYVLGAAQIDLVVTQEELEAARAAQPDAYEQQLVEEAGAAV